jgi:nitrogen regulatory protein PII
MAYIVVLVLDNPDQCTDVLTAWEEAEAPGATILESTGMHRVRGRLFRDDVPLFPSVRHLAQVEELRHRTIFAVIENEETLERVIAATEALIDFSQPHSGLLFTVPVGRVVGLKI